MSYHCPICNDWGKHYSSLCQKNTDPNSIFQKRRKAGIGTPGDTGSKLLRDGGWEKAAEKRHGNEGSSRGRSRTRSGVLDSGSTCRQSPDWIIPEATPSEPSRGHTNTTSRKQEDVVKRLEEIEDTKKRIEQLDDEISTEDVTRIRRKFTISQKCVREASLESAKTLSRRLMNDKSPSPTKARILRSKIAATESAERREWRLPTVERGGCTKYTAEKAALLVELYEEEQNGGVMEQEVEYDIKKRELVDVSDDVADVKAPSFKGYVLTTERYYPSSAKRPKTDRPEEMDVDMNEYKPKVMKHCDFVRKLMECRPEMHEAVNKPARRPTALDLWDNDDDRRFKMMSIP